MQERAFDGYFYVKLIGTIRIITKGKYFLSNNFKAIFPVAIKALYILNYDFLLNNANKS